MSHLTQTTSIEELCRRLAALFDARGEWFYAEARGAAPCALRREEIELRVAHNSLFLTLPSASGVRAWRVEAWQARGAQLDVRASRRSGAVRAVLEFTPRASVGEARASLAAARHAYAVRLSALAAGTFTRLQLKNVTLSPGPRRDQPGRYARAEFETRVSGGRTFFMSPVVELAPFEADAFLAAALTWFLTRSVPKANSRARREARLILAVPANLSGPVAERLALLLDSVRALVSLCEVDAACENLAPVNVPKLETLLARAPRPPTPLSDIIHSEAASRIIELAPDAIDVARSSRGETLRFRGLSFARVRRVMGRELVWFGVEAQTRDSAPNSAGRASSPRRRLLDDSTRDDFFKLLEELRTHRYADSPDARHALYRAAPEAWLESLLRRDVSRLDPGLRLAPLHAQFPAPRAPSDNGARTSARPVDLLALRRDGRLVVVELKVSADAALPLQAADYWRRVAAAHRAGHVRRARLFGDAEIADELPLVYLAAPLTRFHRSCETLARLLAPAVEMYRFDLNEDWRAGVRVARRTKVRDMGAD